MGVKTAFLNGNLEKDIYMQQPEGFVADKKGKLVYKLQNPFMDLSRHLGVGIFYLTKRSSLLDSYRIQMSLVYTKM